MIHVTKPKAELTYPTAHRIADEMRPYPDLLRIRRSYLARDLMCKYRCNKDTAYRAILYALEAARPQL